MLGISDVSPYNEDLESIGIPEMVAQLRHQVKAADGLQLRQSLVFTNSPTLLQPEVLLSYAQEKFDASGHLADE